MLKCGFFATKLKCVSPQGDRLSSIIPRLLVRVAVQLSLVGGPRRPCSEPMVHVSRHCLSGYSIFFENTPGRSINHKMDTRLTNKRVEIFVINIYGLAFFANTDVGGVSTI